MLHIDEVFFPGDFKFLSDFPQVLQLCLTIHEKICLVYTEFTLGQDMTSGYGLTNDNQLCIQFKLIY